MKNALYIIILLFTFSLSAQEKCLSKVSIVTDSDSAIIFLNAEQIGVGHVDTNLQLGNYEIVIMQSLQKWGSDVITDSVKINDCEKPLVLEYNFENKTILSSSPDASVFYGDSLLGYTPIIIPLKYQSVSLQQKDYRPKEVLLASTPVQPNIELEYLGNGKREPFIESTLFKVLVGSALALGATAAYFKLEADKKFDKYIETRNRKYLDDTDRLDIYSGIAFGALQINFGALLYFFLTE